MNTSKAASNNACNNTNAQRQICHPADPAVMTPPSMSGSPEGQDPFKLSRNYPAPTLRQDQPTPPPEPSQAAQQGSRPNPTLRDSRLPKELAPSPHTFAQSQAPTAQMVRRPGTQLMPPSPNFRESPSRKTPDRRTHDFAVNEEWPCYNDPSLRTHQGVPDWTKKNPSFASIETRWDFGNVTSPTPMIGLPCGSIIELANWYGPDDPNNSHT